MQRVSIDRVAKEAALDRMVAGIRGAAPELAFVAQGRLPVLLWVVTADAERVSRPAPTLRVEQELTGGLKGSVSLETDGRDLVSWLHRQLGRPADPAATELLRPIGYDRAIARELASVLGAAACEGLLRVLGLSFRMGPPRLRRPDECLEADDQARLEVYVALACSAKKGAPDLVCMTVCLRVEAGGRGGFDSALRGYAGVFLESLTG